MNQMLSSSLGCTISSRARRSSQCLRGRSQQSKDGQDMNTPFNCYSGEKQVKKDLAQHHAVPTGRTILRLEVGRQFSQSPNSAFLSKPCLFFSIPADWQHCRVIPDLNPHKKNSLALFIYSVTKGITQALLLLWALPVSRVQCWSYRVSCVVSLHVTNQETLSFHGAKITAREKHIKICPCHANLRNRHHKELVSSLVPERPPWTGA